jgi:hypothetical protein
MDAKSWRKVIVEYHNVGLARQAENLLANAHANRRLRNYPTVQSLLNEKAMKLVDKAVREAIATMPAPAKTPKIAVTA